jgi:hypothetical protein
MTHRSRDRGSYDLSHPLEADSARIYHIWQVHRICSGTLTGYPHRTCYSHCYLLFSGSSTRYDFLIGSCWDFSQAPIAPGLESLLLYYSLSRTCHVHDYCECDHRSRRLSDPRVCDQIGEYGIYVFCSMSAHIFPQSRITQSQESRCHDSTYQYRDVSHCVHPVSYIYTYHSLSRCLDF